MAIKLLPEKYLIIFRNAITSSIVAIQVIIAAERSLGYAYLLRAASNKSFGTHKALFGYRKGVVCLCDEGERKKCNNAASPPRN